MKSNKFFSIFLSILILFVFIASASATDTNSTDTLSTVDNNEILSIENNMNKTTPQENGQQTLEVTLNKRQNTLEKWI